MQRARAMIDPGDSPHGPDLAAGIPLADLPDGAPFAGHAQGKPVVLVRRGDEVFALGASCTHYGGPLGEGLVVGDTIRCPWHHACFSLRTGEALKAPALDPVARWKVEVREGLVSIADHGLRVAETREIADYGLRIAEAHRAEDSGPFPQSVIRNPQSSYRIVIVGTGAAGHAAAEMLRREGYRGSVTMIGADDAAPYDRPNLSKDYLAGTAESAWIPLRPDDFYASHGIELIRGTRVARIDVRAREVVREDGQRLQYDRLLLATGADPVRLPLPGADLPHVHYLRTLADSEAIITGATHAKRAVVMGASFIGLEVAASLRTRGLEVHVVAPEAQPLERILGPELGAFIRGLHEQKGVVFHLGQVASAVSTDAVTLEGTGETPGPSIPADLVVIGVGVRPNLALAEGAGLAIDRGVSVNEFLETSVPGIYAAGDIARWPDPHTGERIRVEHWVVAQRQGQAAGRNMLGRQEPFTDVPFFWSAHYDTAIRYVGHAERWDEIVVDGDLAAGDATVTYRAGRRTLAVATVGRDRAALEAEAAMERVSAREPA